MKKAVALVTGAANGLGRATVNRFLADGVRVVGCDIVNNVEDPLGSTSSNFHFVKADVREEKDIQNVLDCALEKFGHLDYAVSCAGIGGAYKIYSTKTGKSIDLIDFERVLDINLLGTFNVNRLAAKVMARNDPDAEGCRGVIINTSGFPGKDGRITQSALAAACGGIDSMTLPLARDLGSLGIRVATISPGLFETPLTSTFDQEVTQFFEQIMPFPNRFGKPLEFTDLVVHIIQNSMINGEVLLLDAAMRLPGY